MHDAGQEIRREHQISPVTIYKWKKQLPIEQDEAKWQLKQLAEEHARLKKMYAELSLDPHYWTFFEPRRRQGARNRKSLKSDF